MWMSDKYTQIRNNNKYDMKIHLNSSLITLTLFEVRIISSQFTVVLFIPFIDSLSINSISSFSCISSGFKKIRNVRRILNNPFHLFSMKLLTTKCIFWRGIKVPNIASNQPTINSCKFRPFSTIYIIIIIYEKTV